MTVCKWLRIALVKALTDRDWDTAIDIARVLRNHVLRRDGHLSVELTGLLESAEKRIVQGMNEDRAARLPSAPPGP